MNHGPWADCYGPVVYGGGEENCGTHSSYNSEQVNEPAVRAQQVCVAPNYDTPPYWNIIPDLVESSDEDEDDDESMVVPKRFSHVFTKKTGESENEFAGMALPINKNYDLSFFQKRTVY